MIEYSSRGRTKSEVRILFLGRRFAQQRADAGCVLDTRIEFEFELRGATQIQCATDLALDEAARALKAGQRRGRMRFALQMREVDAPVTKIIVHVDAGERDAAQSRILQL